MNPSVQAYRATISPALPLHSNWESLRFACLDTESTGFDPHRDRIVSISGIGLTAGEIHLTDQFSVILPVAYNTASVTVHGITREASAAGTEEPVALGAFLGWLKDGILVGHHIQHDLKLLNNALHRHYQLSLGNLVIDTAETYFAIREAGGFQGKSDPDGHSLDAFCRLFGIVPHDRHTASGDAFLTAQILLRLLKEAANRGCWNLEDLKARPPG